MLKRKNGCKQKRFEKGSFKRSKRGLLHLRVHNGGQALVRQKLAGKEKWRQKSSEAAATAG